MSSYNAAYHGSGLILGQREFDAFVERYLEIRKTSKEEMVKKVYADWDASEADDMSDAEEEFDDMVNTSEMYFAWSSCLPSQDGEVKEFVPERVSADECSGIVFQPFRTPDGRANVSRCEPGTEDPEYIGYSTLCGTYYLFYSDKELDAPNVFQERPYNSYGEFEQEFKNKLEAYLPEDFDWDAHIGRFDYTIFG